jgi:N-acylneuraminate cytidylyltransferase
MKPICVVPARAGSKRIPGKNLRLLGGKPLLHWIVQAALKSGIFEKIIISSDSREILNSGLQVRHGSPTEVVMAPTRPAFLSDDDARVEHVFKHEVEAYCNLLSCPPEYVCMAMPTAPFTRPASFKLGYERIYDSQLESVFLGVKTDFKTQRTVEMDEAGGISPVTGDWDEFAAPSQLLKETYRPTYGGMFVRTDYLLQTGEYYAPYRQGIVEVPKWEGIDIDTEDDWLEAEQWLIWRQSNG